LFLCSEAFTQDEFLLNVPHFAVHKRHLEVLVPVDLLRTQIHNLSALPSADCTWSEVCPFPIVWGSAGTSRTGYCAARDWPPSSSERFTAV